MSEKKVALVVIEHATDDGPRRLNPGDSVAGMSDADVAELSRHGSIGTEADLARLRALEAAERERDAARAALRLAEENVREVRGSEGGIGTDRRG